MILAGKHNDTIMKKLFVIFVLLAFNSASYCQNNNGETKILFIGASYFDFFDLPGLFVGLTESAGRQTKIGTSLASGIFLEDHANRSYTLSKINEEKWDYVVLQGVGSLTAYPEQITHHPVYPALEKLKQQILQNCPTTVIIFCMPWAFEDGMTWVEGWTDTFLDMQSKIYENTIKYSNRLGLTIAPVGDTWSRVLEEKDWPLHYLHMNDWNHPSLKGTFLMACVIYSTIYVESCEGLGFNGGVDEDEAAFFKNKASNAVLNSPDLWNIKTTSFIKDEEIPTEINLYQNYPNPFNPETTIAYSISENPSNILLEVYDPMGNCILTLANGNKSPGVHYVNFKRGNLSSGVYFYRLKADKTSITKKFILLK